MVVDLGAPTRVDGIRVAWTSGRAPAARVEFSVDGLTYEAAGTLRTRGRGATLDTGGTTRYVALDIRGRRGHDARVVSLSVLSS
jgi:hypothetical protein